MSPISHYFQGSGNKVMKKLRKSYGEKKGKEMFYKIANKEGMNPKKKKK